MKPATRKHRFFRAATPLLAALCLGLAGCGEDKPDTIGEHIDKGIQEMGQAVEDAGEDIQDKGGA